MCTYWTVNLVVHLYGSKIMTKILKKIILLKLKCITMRNFTKKYVWIEIGKKGLRVYDLIISTVIIMSLACYMFRQCKSQAHPKDFQ